MTVRVAVGAPEPNSGVRIERPANLANAARFAHRQGIGEEATPKAPGRQGRIQDYITHRRDEDGSRIPRTSAFLIGTLEDIPFEETPMQEIYGSVAQIDPGLARDWKTHHDHILLPSIRELHRVNQEEWDLLEEENEAARGDNACIDAEIQRLKAEIASAETEARQVREQLDEPLAVAEHLLNITAARAGGDYVPEF